jgi:hypothetical protein
MRGMPRADPAAIAANGSAGINSPSATGENGGTTVRPATAFCAATRSRAGRSRSAWALSGAMPSSFSIWRVDSSAAFGGGSD